MGIPSGPVGWAVVRPPPPQALFLSFVSDLYWSINPAEANRTGTLRSAKRSVGLRLASRSQREPTVPARCDLQNAAYRYDYRKERQDPVSARANLALVVLIYGYWWPEFPHYWWPNGATHVLIGFGIFWADPGKNACFLPGWPEVRMRPVVSHGPMRSVGVCPRYCSQPLGGHREPQIQGGKNVELIVPARWAPS